MQIGQIQETGFLTVSHPTLVRILPPAPNSNAADVDNTDGECFRRPEPPNTPLQHTYNDVDSSMVLQQGGETQLLKEEKETGLGSAHENPASDPDTSDLFWDMQGKSGLYPDLDGQKASTLPANRTDSALTFSYSAASGWPGSSHESHGHLLQLSASAPELTEFRRPLYLRQSVASRKSQSRFREPPSIVKVEASDGDASTKPEYSSQGASQKFSAQKPPKVSRYIIDEVPAEGVRLDGLPARGWGRFPENGEPEELSGSVQDQVAECQHAGTSNLGTNLPRSEKKLRSVKTGKHGGEVGAVAEVGKLRSKANGAADHMKSSGKNVPSQTVGDVEGRGKIMTAEQHRFLDQFLDSIIADSVERTEERFRESLNSYQRQSQLRAGVVPFRPRTGERPIRGWPETLR